PPAASPLHEVSPQHACLHVSDSCSPATTPTGAAQQSSPRQAPTPSRLAKTAMTSGARQSAQAHTNSEISRSQARSATERHVHIHVCLESATAEAEPSSRPVRRSNQLKNGITIRLNAARTIPTAECSGSLRPISARTASTLTYAARAKNDTAMTRKA